MEVISSKDILSDSDDIVSVVLDVVYIEEVANELFMVIVVTVILLDDALVESVMSEDVMVVVVIASDEDEDKDVDSSVAADEDKGGVLVIIVELVLVDDSIEVMVDIVDGAAMSKSGKVISSNATDMNRESVSYLGASVQSRTICSILFALGLV